MSKKYITTTLPYVNADPHIGYGWEATRADIWARYQRQRGNEVFFNVGVDERGAKIFERAREVGLDTQEYCDRQVVKWQALRGLLNLSFDNFIRTTDEHHIGVARAFWRQVRDNGFIYKKKYRVKYCVGCELEKTDSELSGGRCSLHPNRQIEEIEEDNYFFKFSAFQQKLLDFYADCPNFVTPAKRFNEIKKFVQAGLRDFSISRLKSKMPWGAPVPEDDEQVMYVWFDALVNYVSAIGWPDDLASFSEWWPAIQVAGKDNLRQQAAMWQAMLMAAGLPPSRRIFIGSFFMSNGQKMSKSLGNVIAPEKLVKKFGVDGTRYLFAGWPAFGEDVDVSWEKMTEKYNAELANGLGNLVSRVFNLIERDFGGRLDMPPLPAAVDISGEMEEFELTGALEKIKTKIDWANKRVDETHLWEIVKTDKEKAREILAELLGAIAGAAENLRSFMPATAGVILDIIRNNDIKKVCLFNRV